MKPRLNIFGFAASAGLLLLTAGCGRDIVEQPAPGPEAERLPASLSLTMSAPDIYRATIGPDTRNLVTPDDESGWTPEQLLADGRTIRRLTVMLVDSISREMVAYRHIIYNGVYQGQKPIHTPLLCRDDAPEGGNGFVDAGGAVDVDLPSSDRVRLTFDYDHPLHGEVERLKHGKYVLIAVANYASLPKKNPDEDGGHAAVKDENEFVQQIHTVIHKFYGDDELSKDEELRDETFLRTAGKGIANFGASMSGFYNYVLEVARDKNGEMPYIRKKLDELPLFSVGYIDLQPGENVLTDPIRLYRTYSRVRVEVKNYGTEDLDVNYLGFSDNFSKDRTYFCRMPGASSIFMGMNYETGTFEKLDYEAGAPVVSYGESVIAFPYYNTSIPGGTLDENDKYFIVADTSASRNEIGSAQSVIKAGQTAAVFDAYISPSRDDEKKKYRYTIEVEYKGVDGYRSCSIDGNASPISVSDSYADRYFLLKVSSGDRWIYTTPKGLVCTETMSWDALRAKVLDDKDYSFLWQIASVPNTTPQRYYLRNAAYGDYICNFRRYTQSVSISWNNRINVLTANNDVGLAETFTVSTNEKNGTFLFSAASNSNYMNNSGQELSYMSYWSGDDANSQFQLYPVDFRDGAKLRKEIVLQTFDNATSAVSDVTEIRRNDFVRILVEVSYNPEKGDFDFEVQPWENDGQGGDIVFN